MKVIFLVVLTAFLWGLAPIFDKLGLVKTNPLTAVTIRTIAVTTVLLVYLLLSGKIKDIFSVDVKTVAFLSLSGIIAGFFAMITFYTALKYNPVSKIVPMVAIYPLFTAILSLLILGEKITPLRILGTMLIILGVWVVRM